MVEDSEADEIVFKLLAGRIMASDLMPYFSKLLYSMHPVSTPGLNTFAVDKKYRMYYDPALVKKWSLSELAACWLHEAGHLWRAHGVRFDEMGENPQEAEAWNKSADGVINSDLRKTNILLPEPKKRYYAESNLEFPDWREDMITEELFNIARKSGKNNDLNSGGSDNSSSDSEESKNDNSQKPSSGESENKSDEDLSGSSNSTEDNENSTGEESSTLDEGSSFSSNDSDRGEGENNETSDSSNAKNTESKNEKHSAHNETLGKKSDCGSGASGGLPRDYESDDAPAIDESDASQIRDEVARDILEHSKNRGTVPGSLVREASELLDPLADWRKEINAVVRFISATVMGKIDYTYSRPSRRRNESGIILPSLRAPRPPVIVIVLDTSGSMSQKDLARCLTEISAIIKRISRGQKFTVSVINCDAAASSVKVVKDISNFAIIGGGGTDMRVGIKAASEIRPKPDLVITMTDGGTPWPTEIPKAAPLARYVALIVKSKQNRNRRFRSSDTINTPQWMHTILVED